MRATTNRPREFAAIFDAIRPYSDHVNLRISADGLRVQALDSARTVVIGLLLTSDWFDAWEVDHAGELGVSLGVFVDVVRAMTDTLVLEAEASASLRLTHLLDHAPTDAYELHTIELDDELLEVPPPEPRLVVPFSAHAFRGMVRGLSVVVGEAMALRGSTGASEATVRGEHGTATRHLREAEVREPCEIEVGFDRVAKWGKMPAVASMRMMVDQNECLRIVNDLGMGSSAFLVVAPRDLT